MKLIGLTGNIATGKSTVAKLLHEHDFTIIDLDQISHDIVRPPSKTLDSIIKEFGHEFLLPNGHLDRKKLGQLIFNNEEKRKRLNKIMHSAIFWELVKQIAYHFIIGTKLVIIDSPLLFETGLVKIVSKVIVIYCDEETQLKRLMKRDQCQKEFALQVRNESVMVDCMIENEVTNVTRIKMFKSGLHY